MNDDNLKPNSERTLEELRENGRKGGKKSAETRRERKTFKDLLNIALQEKDATTGEENAVAVVASLVNKAKQGDSKAFEIIRDTIGENPNKIEAKVGGLTVVVASEEAKKAIEEL